MKQHRSIAATMLEDGKTVDRAVRYAVDRAVLRDILEDFRMEERGGLYSAALRQRIGYARHDCLFQDDI